MTNQIATDSTNGSMPLISVVVPALNAAATITQQLDALAAQAFDRPWEIVVVDNGSMDATASIASSAACHPRCVVRVISEPKRGLNVARNAGVSAATADCIALCDSDDIVEPGWLTAMHDELQNVDIVGGYLKFELVNEPVVLELLGWAGSDLPQSTVGRGLGFLPQVVGANLGFRREAWTSLNGFDERFDFGGDDVDFAWRAQLAGCTVGARSDAVVNYRGRSSKRALFRQYVRDGSGAADLYALHRANGMPRRSVGSASKSIALLIVQLPTLRMRSLASQGHLIRSVGKQWGRIRGSFKHKVIYL